MLSSATEATTQSSLAFQEKSLILLVCPPWMNSSSGGPSSASSGDCITQKPWFGGELQNREALFGEGNQQLGKPSCVR
jgi:hypothetical protein